MIGGIRTTLSTAAILLTSLVIPAQAIPASANSPVTITASGPAVIVAGTDAPTGRITAEFSITDTSRTATGAVICRNYAEEKRKGCQYLRFDGQGVTDDDDYWDDEDDLYYDSDDPYMRWDITGQPGNWRIAYPIGFEEISRQECLTAAWNKKPDFSASIEVMNDAGTILATSAWPFKVTCIGIEGGVARPDKFQVYSGKPSSSKAFNFYVVDTKHSLTSYRVCDYRFTGSYANCDREDLTKSQRSTEGWNLSYTLNFRAIGSASCSYIDRKWPEAGIRIQFYDKSMRQKLTLYGGTQLRC